MSCPSPGPPPPVPASQQCRKKEAVCAAFVRLINDKRMEMRQGRGRAGQRQQQGRGEEVGEMSPKEAARKKGAATARRLQPCNFLCNLPIERSKVFSSLPFPSPPLAAASCTSFPNDFSFVFFSFLFNFFA